MATNAKEYKDLTQATSIDSNAQVALAQPNANELQTTTVTNLAEKVQEINTDGPLAELELATSMGKQQLATALTNKGVTTTPSETLIQMADKVNNLNIDGTVENMIGPALSNREVAPYTMGATSYTAIDYCPYTRGYVIWYNGTLRYIPDGNYANAEEFYNAATSIVNTTDSPSTEKSNYVVMSPKGTKVAIGSNSHLSVYSIDNNTLTLIKEVAHPHVGSHPYVDETGNYVLFVVNNYGFYVHNMSTHTSTLYDKSWYNYNSGVHNIFFIDNKLYLFVGTDTSTREYDVQYPTSTDEDLTITLATTKNIAGYYYVAYMPDGILYMIRSVNTQINNYYTAQHSIISYDNYILNNSPQVYNMKYLKMGLDSSSGSSGGCFGHNALYNYIYGFSIVDGKFIIKNPYFDGMLTYNKNSNTFDTMPNNKISAIVCAYSNSYGGSWQVIIYGGSDFFITQKYDISYYLSYQFVTNVKTLVSCTIRQNQLLMKTTKTGNNFAWEGTPYFLYPSKINSGDYDINTQITPAVPDTND